MGMKPREVYTNVILYIDGSVKSDTTETVRYHELDGQMVKHQTNEPMPAAFKQAMAVLDAAANEHGEAYIPGFGCRQRGIRIYYYFAQGVAT